MDHRHSHKHSRKKSKEKSSSFANKIYTSGKSPDKRNKNSARSNREYRLITDKRENYPDGYVEDCSIQYHSSSQNIKNSTVQSPIQSTFRYSPTSVILSTTSNLILTQASLYEIHFSTGIAEGDGIVINETGNTITFIEEGSYRFEIYGEAALFSDVDVKLVFFSDNFTDDLKPFTETNIPKDEGKLQLRGIATILPLQKDQTVSVRLIPEPDESIALLANTRLLIHRVA